ncbi:MAG: AAA family ATPase, partial [Methylococcaceae bacterium]
MLGFPEQAIKQALDKQGVLARSGLLKIKNSNSSLWDKLALLSGLSAAFEQAYETIDRLFDAYIIPAPAAELSAKHYEHIQTHYQRLQQYLKNCLEQKLTGANVLIYGDPGTGKTQLVRAIAAELKLNLYEIAVEGEDNDVLAGEERISACQLGQFLLGKSSQNCILFDEVEDVFPSHFMALFNK